MPSWRVSKSRILNRRAALDIGANNTDTKRHNISILETDAEKLERRKLLLTFTLKMKVRLPNGQIGTVERIDHNHAVVYVREPFGPRTRVQSYAPKMLTPL